MPHTFKHNTWVDNRRVADGMQVIGVGSHPTIWVVNGTAPDTRILTTCPCCNRTFTAPELAQSAADAYFPLNPGDSDWVNADGQPILDELAKLIRQLAARQP